MNMRTSIVRFIMSAGLGLVLALPVVSVGSHVVRAASLTTDNLLSSEFTGATGLGNTDLKVAIGGFINIALGFLGILAVCIMLYGGFKWMTAGGQEKKVEEAQRLIIASIIGLAIILASYAIASFVISAVLDATNNNSSTTISP
jgi:hypothetical protein